MKKITTFLILLTATLAQAQDNTINYLYDAAGNRQYRSPVNPHSTDQGEDETSDPRGENLPMEELLALVNRTANTTATTNNANNTKLNQNDKDVSSTTLLNNITVYPNPATDIVYLNKEGFGIQKEAVATVYLINSQGKILERIKTTDTRTAIDVRHLAGGVYYVRYLSDGESLAWRVVKL